jgi:DeoR/GlpR family transcriptional regulator of sugar metabolism
MTPKARLLTEQRRRSVLDLVDQDGQVTVVDMVRRFSISAVTVRNDLDALASIGAVVRSHGGAVRRLKPLRITRSAPKKLCTGMKKSESEGLRQNWYGRVKPSFSIQERPRQRLRAI